MGGVLLALSLSAASVSAAPAGKSAVMSTTALDRLEAEVTAAEDVNAIKTLQLLYDHYVARGLWNDFADLFGDEAHGYYGGGIYLGRESMRKHFFLNLGLGRNGLAEGRIYNHMMFQPVVHLDPGGKTAKSRWRILAQLGGISGTGNATWFEGIYEQQFIKERGVWRIQLAHGFQSAGGSYANGWSKPANAPAPGSAPGARSQHPPDMPNTVKECGSYPKPCLLAFHYPNIASPGGAVWDANTLPAPAPSKLSNAARLADLQRRVGLLADRQAVERLQNAYGHYIDRGRWDQASALFDAQGAIEVGQMGVYVGPARIKAYMGLTGPQGLREGQLNDHMQVAPMVVVAPDGMTARSYLREIGQTGQAGAGSGKWSEGIEDNVYVKVNGVWKIKSLHLYSNATYDYDKGWGKDAQPIPGRSATLPPDRPPTVVYASYPKQVIATFPFDNPGSLEPVEYPTDIIVAPLDPAPKLKAPPAVQASLAEVQRRADRVKDVIALENLQNAYGFYAEKNLWNDVAQMMSTKATYEVGQRGVYVGRDSILNFLTKTAGPVGPHENQLADHLIDQPVITVSADGKTAKIRSRLLRFGGVYNKSATWEGGVYENEAVKEDGVWKLSKLHEYDTYIANYDGGWTKGLVADLPGPSTVVPPDRPPTAVYKPLPAIAAIPTHYPNPVTGK